MRTVSTVKPAPKFQKAMESFTASVKYDSSAPSACKPESVKLQHKNETLNPKLLTRSFLCLSLAKYHRRVDRQPGAQKKVYCLGSHPFALFLFGVPLLKCRILGKRVPLLLRGYWGT